MNRDEFHKLPEWMQELWALAPNIARQAEKHINDMKADNTALRTAAREYLNATPQSEIELALDVWGYTNTKLVLEKRDALAARLDAAQGGEVG